MNLKGYVILQDLAARNVLVSREEICKVADFGLSREVIDDEYNVQKVCQIANLVCMTVACIL